MRLTHRTPADYRQMPWKNGGGMTTEIMVESDGSATSFDWRLSIAEVTQSGPFSDFSGYERTIMLLDGAGFTLDFDKAPTQRLDRPFEPFRFAGEWRADCTLIDGPIRDFNLIAARERISGSLDVLRVVPGKSSIAGEETLVIYVLRGELTAAGQRLAAGDALRIDDAEQRVEIGSEETSIAAIVRIETTGKNL